MKSRWLAVLAVFALSALSSVGRADSLSASFARGNRAYAEGRFRDAISEYERVVGAGVEDPDVSFNLAIAYGSLGQYGQAIRYFERSSRLRPGDAAVEKALSETRTALAERTAQLTGEAIVADRPPLAEALFSRLTTDTLAWTLLLGTWLMSLCGLSLLRVRSEGTRLALGIGAAAASLLLALAGLGLGTRLDWGRSEAKAIVIAPAATLREGPDANAAAKSELAEGTPARILSRDGSYVRVQSGPNEGYLLASEVGEI
ncbi:MAG: tetratricopeptide repeat protein [Myxococcales bacterium]